MLNRLRTDGPAGYVAVLLVAVIGAVAYSIRADSVFACQARGYGPDHYLAYCNVDGYGEYDHGAFWYGLEPGTYDAARKADVIFFGNSRLQFAFSTKAAATWFESQSIPYYLLGFSENERYRFEEGLVDRIGARARVYVVNVDRFFEESVSPSARQVMGNDSARDRIDRKRVWQRLHEPACAAAPALCGREYAIFRSRTTGAWMRAGRLPNRARPTSEDPRLEQKQMERERVLADQFLRRLDVPHDCVLLTSVPTVNGRRAHAKGLAAALGHELIAPEIEGLTTFDGSHLDDASAERWSAAFLEQARRRIRNCTLRSGDLG
jgi:hypothetical protein